MSIRTDIKRIGPTTFRAVIQIRDRSLFHCNGSVTYARRVQAMMRTWKKLQRAARRPWVQHWMNRPERAHPGSFEFARRRHLEMERTALRRPRELY